MFLSQVWVVLVRRWYLVVAAVLLTAAAGAVSWRMAPPSYTSTAEVLLLPPGTTVPSKGNAYLYLDGLTPAGDVLARALSSPQSEVALRQAGLAGTYLVELDVNSPAPIVLLTTEATTPEDSTRARDLLLERLPSTLKEVQRRAEVPPVAFITASEISHSATPSIAVKGPLRALIVAVGGTLVLAMLVIAAVDALLRPPAARQQSGSRESGSRGTGSRESGSRATGSRESGSRRSGSRESWNRGTGWRRGRSASSAPSRHGSGT